jgi:hypothetical protein
MFGELFRKYRLRANFVSLCEFGDEFAQKGYCYETSIFSHWQKSKRVPNKRFVIIAVIALFVERKAITSLREANEFLEASGHGYLTLREQDTLRAVAGETFFT